MYLKTLEIKDYKSLCCGICCFAAGCCISQEGHTVFFNNWDNPNLAQNEF